jgi:hypothetical protein
MSRTLPTGMATALAAGNLYPVFLVQLDWPSGTVNVWNGYHTLSWDSKSWVGTGHLGQISEVGEASDGQASGIQLSLSGIPSANVANALENDSQGRPAKIYFGLISNDSFAIDPYLVFDGLIDIASIQDDGKTATISVSLEKEMYDDRTTARRYTHEDLQHDYAGDNGFEYVAGLANRQFTWGKSAFAAVGSGGGGRDPSTLEVIK